MEGIIWKCFTNAKDFKISTIVFVFISIAIIISSFSQGVKLSECVWKVGIREIKYPFFPAFNPVKKKVGVGEEQCIESKAKEREDCQPLEWNFKKIISGLLSCYISMMSRIV